MAEKNSFVLYTKYLKQIQRLNMEQRGELFTAILCYASGEELPELDSAVDMAFSFIQDQMDKDLATYMEKCEKRREAGKLGGRPKANGLSKKQEKAKKANGFSEKQNNPDNEYEYEYDCDSEYDNDINKKPDNYINNNKNTMCKSADADALFERLWSLYPHKRGKGQVSKASKRRLLDIGFDEFQRAIDRYKADLDKETWKKPQNGSTFFNSGYVDYLDANYTPIKSSGAKKIGFNNSSQREYDFDELEKVLLTTNPEGSEQ